MRRPSPALIVSSLALVVATGGSSYAAVKIGSGDVKDNSLRSSDIKNGTLRSPDIKNGSLKAKEFGQGQISRKATRWALVDASGAIVAQSGGFTVAAAYPTLANTAVPPAPDNSLRAAGNVYIDAHEDLTDNAIVTTIALQNQVNQGTPGMAGTSPTADDNPEFSGEITAAVCGVAGVAACAPTGTNTTDYFVVSPRNSDGTRTTADTRKRFYVVITGDSRDYVAP